LFYFLIVGLASPFEVGANRIRRCCQIQSGMPGMLGGDDDDGGSVDACPEDAAFCSATGAAMGVSYGNVSLASWSYGDDGLEVLYPNGDMCSSGVPRKTLIKVSCEYPGSLESYQSALVGMEVEDCMVTLRIRSAYGCSVDQFCSAASSDACRESEGLCHWDHHSQTCEKQEGESCVKYGHHHIPVVTLVCVALGLSSLGLCFCCLCVRACRKRRLGRIRRCRRRSIIPAPKAAPKDVEAVPLQTLSTEQQPEDALYPQIIYQPQQQMTVGPYVQLHPYSFHTTSEGMAVPMMHFVAPPVTSIQHE